MTNHGGQQRRSGRGVGLGVAGAAVLVAVGVLAWLLLRGETNGGSGLAVLGSPSARGATASSGPPTPTPAAAPSVPAGRWQTVRAPDESYLVPAPRDGWTMGTPGDSVGYADAQGRPLASANSPSYFQAAFCPRGSSPGRAWVGVVPTPAGVGEPSRAVAKVWASAVSLRADGRQHSPTSPVSSTTGTVDDPGATAVTSTSVVTLDEPDPTGCLPPRVEVTARTVSNEGLSATVVLVRDLDVPGQLTDDIKDRILRSVRPTRVTGP
ncbi:hypothetical protein [Luteipulveratus flavus]|uniref:DUF8017 domain-containing protein n=1 Tax=Luteipulveratus flavus TaxID=3031728 RepID=A0ABT6C9I4_9MICO|nr:hypothetical protein [Luteipulveratus sp. YIM 133296]MDF8264714.1 hypothetical protein [Luteipulveratus sp. YIM 133296]